MLLNDDSSRFKIWLGFKLACRFLSSNLSYGFGSFSAFSELG